VADCLRSASEKAAEQLRSRAHVTHFALLPRTREQRASEALPPVRLVRAKRENVRHRALSARRAHAQQPLQRA